MQRAMRVLQVGKFYPPYKGGMETHLETLCKGLRSSVDLRVVVANSGRSSADDVIDGVPITRLGTLLNLGAAPWTPGLGRVIRDAKADIVHLHLPHPTAILSYLASGYRGRLVVTYHSDIVRQRVLGLAFTPILHAALARASAIICTSPDYIASSRVLARHRERCHVLPFSIATERFEQANASAVARIRAEHGDRIVLAVGRLVSYKGFEHLIRAMSSVRGRLVLVGDGPLRASLESLARDCGIADRVAFLQRVDDVNPYYHAADVFVLSSVARSEAFGLVQLEAMAAGVPVVNTRLASGVPYVSPHGVTGLTVPAGDARALSHAINALLDDPALRRRLGSAGRRRAREDFSVGEMIRQTLAVYDATMAVSAGEPIDAAMLRAVRADGYLDPATVSESSTSPTRRDSTS